MKKVFLSLLIPFIFLLISCDFLIYSDEAGDNYFSWNYSCDVSGLSTLTENGNVITVVLKNRASAFQLLLNYDDITRVTCKIVDDTEQQSFKINRYHYINNSNNGKWLKDNTVSDDYSSTGNQTVDLSFSTVGEDGIYLELASFYSDYDIPGRRSVYIEDLHIYNSDGLIF